MQPAAATMVTARSTKRIRETWTTCVVHTRPSRQAEHAQHAQQVLASHIQKQRAAVGAGCQEAANLQLVPRADNAGKAWRLQGEVQRLGR